MDRHEWAAGVLAPAAGERLLEIGYGPGVTASRVLERTPDGTLVGVDRSAKMAAAAARRNAEYVAAGRVQFRVADWPAAGSLPEGGFDKAYAFNVRLLWSDTAAVDAVRKVLTPGGSLYVFLQLPPPSGPETDAVAAEAAETLRAGGFQVGGVRSGAGAVCVPGRRGG